jgi:hypothetical protein
VPEQQVRWRLTPSMEIREMGHWTLGPGLAIRRGRFMLSKQLKAMRFLKSNLRGGHNPFDMGMPRIRAHMLSRAIDNGMDKTLHHVQCFNHWHALADAVSFVEHDVRFQLDLKPFAEFRHKSQWGIEPHADDFGIFTERAGPVGAPQFCKGCLTSHEWRSYDPAPMKPTHRNFRKPMLIDVGKFPEHPEHGNIAGVGRHVVGLEPFYAVPALL